MGRRVPGLSIAVTPARGYAGPSTPRDLGCPASEVRCRVGDGRIPRASVCSGRGRPRYRGRLCGSLTPMRQTQPLSQQPRRIVGRLAIEGHHRRRHARHAAHLGAPAISHRHHLDVVRAPGNGLVKTMHSHVSGRPSANKSAGRHVTTALPASVVVALEPSRAREERSALNSTRASSSIKRRGSRSPRPHRDRGSVHAGIGANIFFRSGFSTGFSPDVHRISTCSFDRVARVRVDALCLAQSCAARSSRCARVVCDTLESRWQRR